MTRETRAMTPRTRNRLPGPAAAWTNTRTLPQLPAQTFRDWWTQNHPTPKDAP